jgi:hypothetical protein
MKHNKMDGILIDNIISIQYNKNENVTYYMRLLQYLAILAGSWSTINIFTEKLEMPVSAMWINAALILFCTVFYILIIILLRTIFLALLYQAAEWLLYFGKSGHKADQ